MTDDGPHPPPEGKLLRTSRERAIPKLSIRAAAARIGISPEHWGNVERGYKSVSADEPPVRVEASAELLAKMAAAAGVTAGRLETEGQRPDAAEIMRQADGRTAVPGPESPRYGPPRRERRLRALEDSDEPGLQPHIQDVRREVYAAAGIIGMFPPGADLPGPEDLPELEPLLEALPGDVAFPDSTTEPAAWETGDRLSVPERIRLVARIRHMSAKHAGGQRDRRVSGLTASRRLVSR